MTRGTVRGLRAQHLGAALAVVLGAWPAPLNDGPLRLPRNHLVDAQLGCRLDRRLASVALRERLDEHQLDRSRCLPNAFAHRQPDAVRRPGGDLRAQPHAATVDDVQWFADRAALDHPGVAPSAPSSR